MQQRECNQDDHNRHTHWKQTHSARRAAIKLFYIIPAKSYVMLVVIHTWSWSSELSRGFCLWGSLRLRGCSGYSGIWDEAGPALLFLGLSFCLWAHEVNSWLVLPTEPVRMSTNIIYQKNAFKGFLHGLHIYRQFLKCINVKNSSLQSTSGPIN